MILPTQPLPEKGSGNNSVPEMDVTTEWHLGDVILDLYDVRDIFTSGGMGNVYRVHHRGWGIDLAVKSPKPEILKNPKNTDNFIHECETWVNLGLHPNIVSCYYVRRIQGIPRVFSEFVEGGSLSEWIKSGELYQGGESEAITRILDIAIQIAWGINFAHSQRVIHQDIKPANILMTPDGVGKITDFGLAKARQLVDTDQISNGSGNILVSTGGYTPAYCSPEQAAHKKVSEKTDTWSWAVTVLEMFVGEILWVSGAVVDQALKDYSLKKEKPYKVQMPDELVNILSKCLQREVEIRPSLELIVKDLINYYAIKIGTPYPRNSPQIIPGNPSTQSNLALSLLDLGREQESEKIWDEVLRSTPLHLETLYNQGLFHWRSGRITDEAVVTRLEQAQHAQPGDQHGLLYLANIHLERGDISRALDNLRLIDANQFPEAAHAIDYANANLDLERKIIKRFKSNISFISNIKLSRDGKYLLVSGDTDLLDNDRGKVEVMDVSSGTQVFSASTKNKIIDAVYDGDQKSVWCVCESYLSSDENENKVFRWDLKSKLETKCFTGPETIKAASFSESGAHLVCSDQNSQISLWDTDECQCQTKVDCRSLGEVGKITISPNGREAAISVRNDEGDQDLQGDAIILLNLRSGKIAQTFKGHTTFLDSTRFFHRMLVSGGPDRTIRFWNLDTGECTKVLYARSSIQGLAILENGLSLLSAQFENSFCLWDLEADRYITTISRDTRARVAAEISPDGRTIYCAYGDCIEVWKNSLLDQKYEAPSAICLAYSSSVSLIHSTSFEKAISIAKQNWANHKYFDCLKSLQEARSIPGFKQHPDAKRLWLNLSNTLPAQSFLSPGLLKNQTRFERFLGTRILGDEEVAVKAVPMANNVCIFDYFGEKEILDFKGHRDFITSAYIDSERKMLISTDASGNIILTDINSGKIIKIIPTGKYVLDCFYYPGCGDLAVSGGIDQVVRLWDLRHGKVMREFRGHSQSPKSVWLTSNNRYVLSAGGDVLKDAETEEYQQKVLARVFGQQPVSYSSPADYIIRLWDIDAENPVKLFKGHTNRITTLLLSHDEQLLISGSEDKSIRVWSFETGNLLYVLQGHQKGISSLSLKGDQKFLLSGSDDGSAKLWNLGSRKCVYTFTHQNAHRIQFVNISRESKHAITDEFDMFGHDVNYYELEWEYQESLEKKEFSAIDGFLRNFIREHPPRTEGFIKKHKLYTWTEQDLQKLIMKVHGLGFRWIPGEVIQERLESLAQKP